MLAPLAPEVNPSCPVRRPSRLRNSLLKEDVHMPLGSLLFPFWDPYGCHPTVGIPIIPFWESLWIPMTPVFGIPLEPLPVGSFLESLPSLGLSSRQQSE